jgi:outer membrane protein insertion porin family
MCLKAETKPLRLFIYLTVVFCFFLFSCSTVRNFPKNKPFVYETEITLNGKFNTDERKDLLQKLQAQLHDSIRVRSVQKLVFWHTLKNPPVYDSINADKSVIFMRGLLNALGYYRDTITYDTTLNVVQVKNDTQYRTRVHFAVTPGKLTHIDSLSFDLPNPVLQQLTMDSRKESLLQPGAPFAKALISTEFNRLTDIYRNNGFLRFSFEELLAIYDTVGIGLLRPTLDPLEQAQLLEELRQRQENPTADIEVTLRANRDTSHLIRYYVGNVTVFPDLSLDTADYIRTEQVVDGYRVVSYRNLYKPGILSENIFLKRGDLYSQRMYLRTLNRFNAIGSWRLVTIDQIPRGTTDTVDFIVRLTPADKYSFNANIEGSQNFGNSVFTNGNLVGLNLGLQNRNFAKRAYLAATNFRFATEVSNAQRVQARQASFSHTIFFPKAIPNFGFIPEKFKENFKTSFNLFSSFTSRKDFFDLNTFNASWGYDFNWNKNLLAIRLPNIEYTYLRSYKFLDSLIKVNRSYEFIFNSGLVASILAGYTVTGGVKDVANVARFNVEASGLLTGFIHNKFLDSNLQRFVKLDAEFRQTHQIRRSAFAWRVFAGAGFQFRSPRFKYKYYLPFYRSYVAGGANSMRAWQLRTLGPGSTVRSFADSIAPDRFGEMALEANAEYRFYVTELFGFKINSALFTDIGNIWYIRENPDFPNGHFRLKYLWRDIAIGAGTGLRVDLGFFLLRLDYAYKLKDPSPDDPAKQNKFFPDRKITSGQFQLGVTYPF